MTINDDGPGRGDEGLVKRKDERNGKSRQKLEGGKEEVENIGLEKVGEIGKDKG